MKKPSDTRRKKLALETQTVKTLAEGDLNLVVGGTSNGQTKGGRCDMLA